MPENKAIDIIVKEFNNDLLSDKFKGMFEREEEHKKRMEEENIQPQSCEIDCENCGS